MIENIKAKVVGEIDSMQNRLVEIAKTIHMHPEIGFQEHKTAKLFIDELEKHGFTVVRGIAGLPTAFKASYPGGTRGPRVAFLAELDALPGLGHACGHNIIGTASVGAGIAVSKVIAELPGTIIVFGTPAEEAAVDNAGGKVHMLEDIKEADAAMLVHPSNKNIVVRRNVCREALKLEFLGKAAHAGSAPHLGINALDAAVNTLNLVNALRQHVKSDVRIHAIITHGGDSPNIVPSYAALKMYVRAIDANYLDEVVEKVKNCAQGAALGTGVKVKIHSYAARYLNMVSNPTLAALFTANWNQLGLKVEEPIERSYGSTDMGNVSQEVPALHPYIAIGSQDLGGHSVAFREAANSKKGFEALILAAKGLAMTAIDLLFDHEKVQQMKKEFKDFQESTFVDY